MLRDVSEGCDKDTQTVVSALIKHAKTLPNELYKFFTWDRGKELADHLRFMLATNIYVYFSIRKVRGSVVPMRIRWSAETVFSEGSRTVGVLRTHLNKVARQVNERRRKTLEFENAAERFSAYRIDRFSGRRHRTDALAIDVNYEGVDCRQHRVCLKCIR